MNNLINAPNAGIPALSHLNPTMTLPDGELWLSAAVVFGASGPAGSRTNPVITTAIDSYVLRNRVLKLMSGSYTTEGFPLPNGDYAIIAPEGFVSIKLKASAYSAMGYHFSENMGVKSLYLYNLTLDCDWDGNATARKAHAGNYKLGGVSVRAWQGKIERCNVKNFGCDGASLGDLGNEVFPLRLETYAGGPPYDQYVGWAAGLKGESVPCVEIRGCKVIQPHFENGGYCTAIFVRTCQPNAGDRLPIGVRTTPAALVLDNTVEVPGGIAYGCAESDNALFIKNDAHLCKCAFNFDTGSAFNVQLRENKFAPLNQGINFTGASRDVQILSNHIECTSEFFNAKLNRTEPTFTVRLKNNTSTVVDANNITTAKGLPQAVEGSYTGTNSFNSLGLPPAAADPRELKALKTQLAEANRLKAQVEGENLKLRSQVNLGHELNGLLAQAKNERDNLKVQLIEANSVNARLAGENSNLKQDYDDLFEALAGVEKERDAAVERKFALLAQITEAVSILRA